MAFAQRRQRGLFDPDAAPGESPFDHHIWVIASDGDIMEGVSHEASSLAGHQELGNLTVIYDANQISIEDDTDISFSEDVAKRYEAYGWHVVDVDWRKNGDGAEYVEDADALLTALERSKRSPRPTFIRLHTIIAWPAPTKQNTGKSHGSALGDEEVAATKELLGFDPEKSFEVDRDVLAHTRKAKARGKAAHKAWDKRYAAWRKANPEGASPLGPSAGRRAAAGPGQGPADLPDRQEKGLATRAASGKVLAALAPVMPELWGGSADLAESNNTTMEGAESFIPKGKQTQEWKGDPYGRTLHFGIREHAMGMILNGIALEGLTRPYGGTFLVFSDYMRPAVRLAAIQQLPVTFVWTHDSIGLGEDGPTHQPIEHLAALRAIPGLDVVRPADANETAAAWGAMLRHRDRPAGIALTRQTVPVYDRKVFATTSGVAKGGYVLAEALGAHARRHPHRHRLRGAARRRGARDRSRRRASPPASSRCPAASGSPSRTPPTARRSCPAPCGPASASRPALPWAGARSSATPAEVIGIDHFGASADYKTLFQEFGITTEAVVAAAKRVASRPRRELTDHD